MKRISRKERKVYRKMLEVMSKDGVLGTYMSIMKDGKRAIDIMAGELGKRLVEAVFYMEREEKAGPDYDPKVSKLYKWASEPGSVYLGGEKVRVERPRLRDKNGEVSLSSYERLKDPKEFSEELLEKVMAGMAGRRYEETLISTAEHFGVSAGSVSRHIVNATTAQMKEFKERDLSKIEPFAVFMDGISYGESLFMCGLCIDTEGIKHMLGFSEGATENEELSKSFLDDLERRGFKLNEGIIFVIDGGKGMKKALKTRFGKKLILQRCGIHKLRNILGHLAKKYRKEAEKKYWDTLECVKYEDAQKKLKELEKWLREINISAAESLLEGGDELLTLHRLAVPEELMVSLYSTNPIESAYSFVGSRSGKIKRYRGTSMMQRWLATILMKAEKGFRKVRGYKKIKEVVERIKGGMPSELQLPKEQAA
jgi:transposase-like protein